MVEVEVVLGRGELCLWTQRESDPNCLLHPGIAVGVCDTEEYPSRWWYM